MSGGCFICRQVDVLCPYSQQNDREMDQSRCGQLVLKKRVVASWQQANFRDRPFVIFAVRKNSYDTYDAVIARMYFTYSG